LDICWDAEFDAAEFPVDKYLFDLWQHQSIFFTEAIDKSNPIDFCGGYSSVLEYVDGPLFDKITDTGPALDFYDRVPIPSSGLIAFEGVMEEPKWLGTHWFRIRSTLGQPDPSPIARGNGGLYKTIYSDPVPVTIVDPCRNSTVNMDADFFVQNIHVPLNSP